MSEFIYRFRPVDRLLNADGKTGELDSQYIFFSAPEKLNDPLEGYKEVYFCGDHIIWGNMIKHYLRCLIDSCLDYLCSERGATPTKTINVFANELYAPAPLNELNRAIFERLISEPTIKEFISRLATNRKVWRWEILSYFQCLHLHFLDIIFEILHERQCSPDKLDQLTKTRGQRLAKIKIMGSEIIASQNLTKEQEITFQTRHQIAREQQLLARYRDNESKVSDAWFFIMHEYPEFFCKSIERLIYPEWYTACFMSACNDSAIWASYGGNHTDVCLKFRVSTDDDKTSIELTIPNGQNLDGITWGLAKLPFHEVSYEKTFVEIDFFRSLGRLPIPALSKAWLLDENKERSICSEDIFNDESKWRDRYWENFYHAVTVKLKAWDREKESRLILTSTINNLEDIENRKLHYDFNLLEGIIFGINTPTEKKLKIIKRVEVLCKHFQRSEFSFYQAGYDASAREIIHTKLDSIRVGDMSSSTS